MAMDLGINPVIILRLKMIEKVGAGVGLVAVILLAYWYLWFTDMQAQLQTLEGVIAKQTEDIASKKGLLAQKPKLLAELAELQRQDKEASKELPSKKEIPDLLSAVSAQAHEHGLEVPLFAPMGEVKKDIYAEVPVDVTLVGTYHQKGVFLTQIAHLPRIVNVSNLTIAPATKNAGSGSGFQLTTSARITTYRFLDHDTELKGGKPKK